MQFSKYKNHVGDLVDDKDDFVMYGSQVSTVNSSSILLASTSKFNSLCVVYIIDNNTKYYLEKRDGMRDIGRTIHIMDGIS